MIDAVNLIYQDRQNIARNLKDRDQCVCFIHS